MSPIAIAQERKFIRRMMKIQRNGQNQASESKRKSMKNITLSEFQHRILRDRDFYPSGVFLDCVLAGH